MNALSLFGLQLVIALSMSIFVLSLIKPFLKDVLKDTCGTEHSAEFWVRYTQLMMVFTPLVIVIFFAGLSSSDQTIMHLAYVLKQTLLQTLVGELIGLAFVGRIIYRAINTTLELARTELHLQNNSTKTIAKA